MLRAPAAAAAEAAAAAGKAEETNARRRLHAAARSAVRASLVGLDGAEVIDPAGLTVAHTDLHERLVVLEDKADGVWLTARLVDTDDAEDDADGWEVRLVTPDGDRWTRGPLVTSLAHLGELLALEA